MDWHFGYNCRHWVPTLGKCRVLIDRYNRRPDLLADKPLLKTREILAYTEWSQQELIAKVEGGESQAKRVEKPKNPERDGCWRFQLRCSWDWDSCALSETGGRCFSFEPHDGEKISSIADLRDLGAEHPNMEKVPSEDDWRSVEARLSELRVKNSQSG